MEFDRVLSSSAFHLRFERSARVARRCFLSSGSATPMAVGLPRHVTSKSCAKLVRKETSGTSRLTPAESDALVHGSAGFAQFFLQLTPTLFGIRELRGQRCDFVVQPQSLGWIRGRHK